MNIVDTLLAIDTSIHANWNDSTADQERREALRSISRCIYTQIGKYDPEKSERLLDAMDQ
jgi:hypothetical protein